MNKIIIASAIVALIASPAMAQDVNNAATNGTAQAANTVNVIARAGDEGPTDATVHNKGHVYSTPGVGGSYFGGANPCLIGTGAGAAGGPVGFSINIGKSDKGCNRRSDAAAWHALGFDNVAIARMCQDQQDADAFFATTGYACPGTQASGRYKKADGTPADMAQLGRK